LLQSRKRKNDGERNYRQRGHATTEEFVTERRRQTIHLIYFS
jgi:hypothetical protein